MSTPNLPSIYDLTGVIRTRGRVNPNLYESGIKQLPKYQAGRVLTRRLVQPHNHDTPTVPIVTNPFASSHVSVPKSKKR